MSISQDRTGQRTLHEFEDVPASSIQENIVEMESLKKSVTCDQEREL